MMGQKNKLSVLFKIVIMSTFVLVLAACDSKKQYQPTWESLIQHQVPDWLLDAKFGIYAHWGIYSVPAYGNEWYAKRMYDKQNAVYQHHVETYGDPSEFGYKDFVPMFKAENYDPKEWADLIKASGAKYAGFAVVHHDGFLLWESQVNRWNAGNMGPKRDLYGELISELRKKNLKTIATFHHIRTFNWYLPGTSAFTDEQNNQAIQEAQDAGWDLFDPYYADLYWNRYTGKFTDFIQEWKAKVTEVIDKYHPDLLWFDGGRFQETGSQEIVMDILSYYYNQGQEWGKPVEVLNKLPVSMQFNFPREFGVLTFEEGRDRCPSVDRPWIDDMKISTYSWGYIEGQSYKSANEILDGLIDRVSRGGGLLLSLCPKADGTINPPQKEALVQIGEWLKVNGEAIYGTRPWVIQAEGPTDHLISSGEHPKWIFKECNYRDIRFTRRGKIVYAIVLDWPQDVLTIESLGSGQTAIGSIASVRLLGYEGKLKRKRNENGLIIELPLNKPGDFAYVFKIEPK